MENTNAVKDENQDMVREAMSAINQALFKKEDFNHFENKVKKGFFASPPSNDVDEIESFYKKMGKNYANFISGTDDLKVHVLGGDIGDKIPSNVLDELSQKRQQFDSKVFDAKREHADVVRSTITKDTIFYDKEVSLGRIDSDDYLDMDNISYVSEIVKGFNDKNFAGKEVLKVSVDSDDYNDISVSKLDMKIAFSSNELKNNGMTVHSALEDLHKASDEYALENQTPLYISGEEVVSKIPDHRMMFDNHKFTFTQSEWNDVPKRFKKEIKEELGAPSVESLSSRALSLKF